MGVLQFIARGALTPAAFLPEMKEGSGWKGFVRSFDCSFLGILA